MKKVLFYIAQEYYWESLEPIYIEYEKDKNYDLYLKIGSNQKRYFKIFLRSQKKSIEKKFADKGYKITDNKSGFDIVFAGAQLKDPEQFGDAKLCNVDHGPGIKTLRYRHLLKQKKVKYYCFVEGQYRIEKFKKYGLDKIHNVYDTGLPKLDKFFNGYFKKEDLIRKYRLDENKKTVLYAPSYKPTSIFSIGPKIPQLSDKYNVIIKLHPYSWGGKYASHSQHKIFEKIVQKFPKIILVSPEISNILPYMFLADTMISDGSSVINEFLALGRCGIIVNLPEEKNTHHDGQPLLENKNSEWLKGSFIHIKPEDDIQSAVKNAIGPSKERLDSIYKDRDYIFSHKDGKAAFRVKRIMDNLLEEQNGSL